MDIKRLVDRYAVSAQLQPDELAEIARRGERCVVCHRPDAQMDEQPTYEAIAVAARDAGLEVRHQPIAGTGVLDDDVGKLARRIDCHRWSIRTRA